MGETVVDIGNEKTETLDKLIDLDRKLTSSEILENASKTCERNKLMKKYRSLGGNYDWTKKTV